MKGELSEWAFNSILSLLQTYSVLDRHLFTFMAVLYIIFKLSPNESTMIKQEAEFKISLHLLHRCPKSLETTGIVIDW
jgi:hypothetical protein